MREAAAWPQHADGDIVFIVGGVVEVETLLVLLLGFLELDGLPRVGGGRGVDVVGGRRLPVDVGGLNGLCELHGDVGYGHAGQEEGTAPGRVRWLSRGGCRIHFHLWFM